MNAKSTIFTRARLWTSGWASPRKADLRIAGDRVVELGGPGSLSGGKVVHLDGGLLLPGFQDAHAHPMAAGRALLECDLSGETTLEATLAAIAEHAKRTPAGEWLQGGGWSKVLVTSPHRDLLDPVTGDHPAVYRSSDCHSVLANSAALRLAGIDRSTPDPARGRIVRDRSGAPTGLLDETAIDLVERALPPVTQSDVIDGLLRGEQTLLDLGVVAWQDAIVGTGLGMVDTLDAYSELVKSERLTARVTAAIWWDPARGVEQLAEVLSRKEALELSGTPDQMLADTVKVMIDGAGIRFLPDDVVADIVTEIDAAGLSIHFHACSDRAVRAALDAVEAARRKNGVTTGRHHIAHIMVIAASDLPRFRELGVTANMQAAWADHMPPIELFHEPFIDAHPEHHAYAFGQLARFGAPLCAGSDWPVSSPDPLVAAAVATGRRVYEGGGASDVLESLDLAAFFEAYTSGSARINGRGDRTGRIAEGYLADLVHLSADPFSGGELSNTAVDGVWIGGRQVRGRD